MDLIDYATIANYSNKLKGNWKGKLKRKNWKESWENTHICLRLENHMAEEQTLLCDSRVLPQDSQIPATFLSHRGKPPHTHKVVEVMFAQHCVKENIFQSAF